MSNTTCSNSPFELPDLVTLPIPQNITFGAIPVSNRSTEAMRSCCEPKPVHVASGCYEWCELAPRYTNGSAPDAKVKEAFEGCISRSVRGSGIIGVHIASGTGKLVTTTAGLFWMLLAMSMVIGLR